jgi:hypothetical protein
MRSRIGYPTVASLRARRAPGTLPGATMLGSIALGLAGGFTPQARATTHTVETLGDPGPTLLLSLRQAAMMAGSGDTIDFAPGLSGTITLLQGEIPIKQSLTIKGPGPDLISVSGSAASRIFNISNAEIAAIDVTIDGLTLTDGNVTNDNGGAIVSNGANLTISHCVIAGNSATGTGGGLAIDGKNWAISDSLVAGNASGGNGGGLSAFIPNDGVAPVSEAVGSSAFIGNSSSGSGGAIALSLAFIPGDPPVGPISIDLVNVTIARNAATGPGGGIYANAGASDALTIASSTIVDNRAGTAGGIDVGGAATLIDSIVANNPVLSLSGGDVAGTFTANYNLIKAPATAMLNGSHNIIGVDPLLGELGMNGGPTPTRLPIAKSPVIDAGDPAFLPPPDYDQRGLPRVAGGAIDIGAVERQAIEDDVFRGGFENN